MHELPRTGRYHLAKLIERHGADLLLTYVCRLPAPACPPPDAPHEVCSDRYFLGAR
jgi:hypothetical protein